MCMELLAYSHTRERRALANGLSRSPGTMLCGRLLLRGRMVGLFWFVTAIDLRLLGGSFFDAMVFTTDSGNEKNEWTEQTTMRPSRPVQKPLSIAPNHRVDPSRAVAHVNST